MKKIINTECNKRGRLDWQRAVIKIGSSLITPEGKGCSTENLLPLASFITSNRAMGKELILVSSGAVAAGLSELTNREPNKERTIPEQQALAAIGQAKLMQHWQRLFDFPCAQVLLTLADLENRQRFLNAKNTLNKLLELKALPIINENDSVAVDELKVGDNDNLAAHVAALADADLLVICSDVDGLYDKNPQIHADARLIKEVEKIDSSILSMAGTTQNPIATGGMITKLYAAEKAMQRGINTLIINGCKGENFEAIKQNQSVGTLFRRQLTPLAARKHWMCHLQPVKGSINIDKGARDALENKGASLLPSGILSAEGNFQAGDVIEILLEDASKSKDSLEQIGRGVCQYASAQLEKICGAHTQNIHDLLGHAGADEVIHRNDLIIYNNSSSNNKTNNKPQLKTESCEGKNNVK